MSGDRFTVAIFTITMFPSQPFHSQQHTATKTIVREYKYKSMQICFNTIFKIKHYTLIIKLWVLTLVVPTISAKVIVNSSY